MDIPHNETVHPTRSEKAWHYLLVSLIMAIGIFFLVQGIFSILSAASY